VEATLFYLPISPWSQKLRCALRHHGIRYRERVYEPLIGELELRWRLNKWRGRVTVPVLFAPDRVLTDSFDIARHADRAGSAPSLFPETKTAELADWNARSERLLSAGRGSGMLRMLESPQAAHEMLPPGPAKRLSPQLALLGMRAFNRKYGITPEQRAHYDATVRSELLHLREALRGDRFYLLDALSYADYEMATALSVLSPVPESSHGPAARAVMTDAQLSEEFADLRTWRDAFHARHPLI
jgi:glutathione S-transferase